ncbi:DNA-directed RNA polymerase I and III 16 kDa polypeptide [Mrakia frigida]|uniref:DNA-directed RNA polymerase core subunit RPC19 n=1 Tax=Mrakia frigida TaxID=29902 RepID=UPI003FCC0C67
MSDDAAPALGYDPEKIVILDGATPGLTAATFNIKDEDHTLGNALRWMVMKNPDVEFCGYSMPHPSEAKFHLRIQMYGKKSALECLLKALDDLRNLLGAIQDSYKDSLDSEEYTAVQDVDVQAEVERIIREREEAKAGEMEI